MTSTPRAKVRRKSAEDRRAEIVAAASALALSEGLEHITLRSVADRLGVAGSLVSHYFPAVDSLLAEAFTAAAVAESREIDAVVETADLPVDRLLALLRFHTAGDRDRMNLLWLDAWRLGRKRPALHSAVAAQMAADVGQLVGLIDEGIRSGDFTTADPRVSASRILAVLDGLSVQAAMRKAVNYGTVEELVFIVAERELGLPVGAFTA
ncbi:TetR/AcrR family transcriptional regulator [Streptomyces sp. NPDC059076]|uniref:TetR/AcrR family transcriptional regulator n=1 Tax=unclassified Streptomyces TaxID=2593676 RepID=UPI00369A54AF